MRVKILLTDNVLKNYKNLSKSERLAILAAIMSVESMEA
nr:Putative uncharacterized protein [Moritella viscosa]SHO14665.1 Putative uncharacterized protein [Moritella viscosa]SHO17402.1 Putative uncharacterized protein [Moritella viscosa]SHO18824.1 Putative uncharacterized protein [Moritella viscosa]